MPTATLIRAGAAVLLAALCLCLPGAARAVASGGQEPKDRVGTITIEVGWDRSRQEVVIIETCSYTLAARSPGLAQARIDGVGRCDQPGVLRDRKVPDFDGARIRPDRVIQRSAHARAQVRSFFVLYLDRRSGEQKLTITPHPEARADPRSGFPPDVWMVTVTAPKWSFSNVHGPVESQSADSVTWRVDTATGSGKEGPAVARSVELTRSVKTTRMPTARHQTRGEMLTAFALAGCGIGAVAALLVAGLAGPAVPRRWAAATLAFAAVACACARSALPTPPLPPGTTHLDFFYASMPIPPAYTWSPGPVLGLWLWYVLPTAAWWFTRRVVTGRPPSGPTLVASCVSPLLSLVLMAAGGTAWDTGAGARLVAAALAASALALSGQRLRRGSAVRRWAPTAGALLWTVLVTWELARTPVIADGHAELSGWSAVAALVCTWPAAAWLVSLLAPALRRTLGPAVRTACFLLLWVTLVAPFVVAYLPPTPLSRGNEAWYEYRHPLFTDYAAFPFFVMTVCGIAVQIAYLWRRGARGDTGRAVEPVGRVLLVCAALTAFGAPNLRTLTMWGEALAVLSASVASLVLLPIGSAASTARLRCVGRRGHARFMDRWLTTQLIWDTRADFQRSARSALAEDMTVSDFSDRWRGLAVPGRNGDPESRLRRAKRFALGTNAGRSPWTAGLVGAGRAQLLALPWAVYKAVTSGTVGADNFMPFHLNLMFQILRFTHWALYGFVYGYFYAMLRGLTPVGKAAWLMLGILPAEVLPMATLTVDPQYARDPSVNDLVTGCAGVAGQTLVLCMLLGLWWEWSLARAAGMKWSQIRNFRRLSSITVPAGTVLVAGATAFATTIAGTWAQPDLKPPGEVQSSQPAHPSEPAP
ncbi:hypothetical protein AQJ66_13610 [Streptomyces bungoensis]|uniref:Uncharacterized protein n=1 Tax=Streptomyces bungoensis TaxID=285568 RepID=A0A101T4E2_9ACTN|nr:hypothetical protein AQJ66_13610 [Streptomyces bungoensis]